jgi:regulator of replication initiation timing
MTSTFSLMEAALERLHARIAELEAALDSMTIERGTAQAERDEILHDKHDRIAGLEAEIARLVDLTPFTTIADLEARNAVCRRDIEALMRSADSLEARNTELEAERDRLKENLAEEREACAQDAIDYAGIGWRSGAREGIAALIRARAALSDPSGE